MNRKTVILITGPTASGKTPLAIGLASTFHTSIISADSRQCFSELNIGVAKPATNELAAVRHYFISSHSVHDTVTAATFESYALHCAFDIFKSNDVLIMAGGTGLYIKAFCEGLDQIPAVPENIRSKIIAGFETHGMQWLQQQVAEHDPLYMQEGEPKNPQRLMRALEVKLATGSSIREYQQRKIVTRDFDIVKLGISISKDKLHEHINNRVDSMMSHGLLDEVISLQPYRNLNALQTVGYSELFEHIDGKISLEQAVEQIKKNTKQYAKRQMTWFKKDPSIKWMPAEEIATFVLQKN